MAIDATNTTAAGTGVRLVKPSDRVLAAQQTPGMVREAAIEAETLWAGIARTAPGNRSGWHHHGNWSTVVYVIQGAVRLEYGASGLTTIQAEAGDHLYIPQYEVHRESNPMEEEQVLAVVRVGNGPVVINVDAPQQE